MKIEDQVISLGLAKKLKKLEVKQESLFWWLCTDDYAVKYGEPKNQYHLYDLAYSAFTVAELIGMLQKYQKYAIIIRSDFGNVANYLASEVIKYEKSKV